MKGCLPLALWSALSLCAQAPSSAPAASQAARPAPAVNLGNLPPGTLVATVDGKKVTASELQAILRVLPAGAQQQAMANPRQFLEQYGLLKRLSGMAEQSKLYERSPLKEQLEYNRMVGLAQAQLVEAQNQIAIQPEEIQKHYESHKDDYAQAKVKVIYIPFSPNPPAQQDPKEKKVLSEAEAKAEAEKILAEIRSGADFVKLVKEHSGDPVSAEKDGDFGAIRRTDKIPDAIKNVVFSLKQGEVSEPVRQPNGFYLFRVEETAVQGFNEVKDQIANELRQVHFDQWVRATQKSIEIKIENEAAFAPAAPQPANK